MPSIDIDFYDVQGLEGIIDDLRDEIAMLRFAQERLRFLIHRDSTLQRHDNVCVVCGRAVDADARQPRLCVAHLIELPCPDCLHEQVRQPFMLRWSPKRHRATCPRCKTAISGRAAEKLIYDYWRRKYED